ncbi:MAG: WXG100 family type VII secretion target [Erysipelotrichaceae bacterium]|jgi:WXG100 family type VII secretion target|nr:WXG100 family type VII secretion target [Erysipelotrichaceae bacterium]
MRIRIEPTALASISSGLKVKGESFAALTSEMSSLISSLPQYWEGRAATAYLNQFEELKPGFVKVQQLIETISTQISQVIAAAEELDSQIAAKF